jgi:Bacteriophage HK97-gp10, putative tail-component
MPNIRLTKFSWFGEQYKAKVHDEQRKRFEIAIRELRNSVIRRLGVKYPPASERGEPPHLRTGELRRSISTEVVEEGDKIIARCGTNKSYAKYLELDQYLGRSFLASTLDQEWARLRDIIIGNKI